MGWTWNGQGMNRLGWCKGGPTVPPSPFPALGTRWIPGHHVPGRSARYRAFPAGGGLFPGQARANLDLFVYCSQVPAQERRRAAASPGDVAQSIRDDRPVDPHWGHGYSLLLEGVETWLMYFGWEPACAELEGILAGKWLDRVDGDFYPLGRCDLFQSMHILYDPDGILAATQARLMIHPAELARQGLACHLADREDLQRVAQRGDVLFLDRRAGPLLDDPVRPEPGLVPQPQALPGAHRRLRPPAGRLRQAAAADCGSQ